MSQGNTSGPAVPASSTSREHRLDEALVAIAAIVADTDARPARRLDRIRAVLVDAAIPIPRPSNIWHLDPDEGAR